MKFFNVSTVTADEMYDYLNDYYHYTLRDEFDELINDSTEEIDVLGVNYSPARVLYYTDLYRYNEMLDEYIWDVANQIVNDAKENNVDADTYNYYNIKIVK